MASHIGSEETNKCEVSECSAYWSDLTKERLQMMTRYAEVLLVKAGRESEHLATDIVGRVMDKIIKFYERNGRWPNPTNVPAYLRKCVYNAIMDYFKGEEKRSTISLVEAAEIGKHLASAEEEYINRGSQTSAWAIRLMKRLPTQQRIAVEHYLVSGKEYTETAEMMNTTVENVRNLVSRGIRRMKEMAAEEGVTHR